MASVGTEALLRELGSKDIDTAISELKMERAECMKKIELWEKAFQIIGTCNSIAQVEQTDNPAFTSEVCSSCEHDCCDCCKSS